MKGDNEVARTSTLHKPGEPAAGISQPTLPTVGARALRRGASLRKQLLGSMLLVTEVWAHTKAR